MGIKYELAPELQEKINEISQLIFPHVRLDSVVCIRSYGSSSRGTIARCHALGKAMQIALNRKGFYVIEVISKRFDKMPYEEKIKTLIHELMHIPKSFGGGFIHHNIVHERNVNIMYQKYMNLKMNRGEQIVDDMPRPISRSLTHSLPTNRTPSTHPKIGSSNFSSSTSTNPEISKLSKLSSDKNEDVSQKHLTEYVVVRRKKRGLFW